MSRRISVLFVVAVFGAPLISTGFTHANVFGSTVVYAAESGDRGPAGGAGSGHEGHGDKGGDKGGGDKGGGDKGGGKK